jgi:hypothetical protein
MRGFLWLIPLFLIFPVISYAEVQSGDNRQMEKKNGPDDRSAYKTSPRLNYKSDKSDEKQNNLESLKPMVNQFLGGQNGETGSAVMPNSGTYKF